MTTTSPIGIPQGSFSVDSSGQATYVLPIALPPGVAGHTPAIALEYQHHGPVGPCGIGWNISGLSAITRTNAIQAIDKFRGAVTFTETDRLSLDGMRMVNVDGAYWGDGVTYYKEQHDWTKIASLGAQANGFTVISKSGRKRLYGTTADSLIKTADQKNVRVWALTASEDLNGNKIDYSYTTSPIPGTGDSENYYIHKITYGATTIGFEYEQSPTAIVTFVAGRKITTSARLKAVHVQLLNGSTFRTYALDYTPSPATGAPCLQNITISGADGKELPPIRFDWSGATPSIDASYPVSTLLPQSATIVETIPMDVNGDGRSDIVQLYVTGQELHAVTFRASPTTGGQVTYTQTADNTLGGYDISAMQVFAGDVNGNGLADLIIAYADTDLLAIDVYLSNGTSVGAGSALETKTTDPWQGDASIGFFAVDADGDGRTDLVQAFPDLSKLSFNCYLSQFTGTSGQFSGSVTVNTQTGVPGPRDDLWAFDVNGDGLVDLVLIWEDRYKQLNATAFVSSDKQSGPDFFASPVDSELGPAAGDPIAILPADCNGDGMMDIVRISGSKAGVTIQSFLSTADGGFTAASPQTFNKTLVYYPGQIHPIGLTGGRQTALLAGWTDSDRNWSMTVYRSLSDGTFENAGDIDTGIRLPDANVGFFVGDANGDGRGDFFYRYVDDQQIRLQPFPSAGALPDLVAGITDMFGGYTSVSYGPLSDSGVYSQSGEAAYPSGTARRYVQRLSPAQYPVETVLGQAMTVVKGYEFKNLPEMNRFDTHQKFQMTYTDARIDANGRGWQGFGTVSTLDMLTGLVRTNTYAHAFPYTGRLISTQVEADKDITNDPKVIVGRTLLGRSVSLLEQVSRSGWKGAQAFEVRETGHFTYRYDYGTFDYLVAAQDEFDDYGNASRSTWWGYISNIDPAELVPGAAFPAVAPAAPDEVVYTHRKFLNDKTAWALGYPLFVKRSEHRAEPDITVFRSGDLSLSARTYAPVTYNLVSKAAYDDANSRFLTSTYSYDTHGNLLTETAPGGATLSLEYETTYGIYPQRTTYPATGHGPSLFTLHGYDPCFGVEVARQDENGNIWISGLDGLGREVSLQGPVPEACDQSDKNAVTSRVTGDTTFSTAKVLTLKAIQYLRDGKGGIFSETAGLQVFPTDGKRSWNTSQAFVDPLRRHRVSVRITSQKKGNAVMVTEYDPCGKVATQSPPFFVAGTSGDSIKPPCNITTTYDVLGRMVTRTVPTGSNDTGSSITTWDYLSGDRVRVTEASGSKSRYARTVTSHFFDKKPKPIRSVVEQDGSASTMFTRDRLGRVISATDPLGVTNTAAYDSLGRVLTMDDPDRNPTGKGNALTSAYDGATGRLHTVTDAAGAVTTYTHDALGRVTERTSTADGRKISYSYDGPEANGLGRLTGVKIVASGDQLFSRKLSYDRHGNTSQETLTIAGEKNPFTVSSVFDPQKRLVTRTYPNGSVMSRTYADGSLVNATLGPATVSYPLEDFDASSEPGVVIYGNGIRSTYRYNSLGVRYGETLENSQPQSKRLDFSFSYDGLHQYLGYTETVEDRTEAFSYENKRLETATIPGVEPPRGSYTYDAGGNFRTKDGNTYGEYVGHFPRSITSGHTSVSVATQDPCGRTETLTVGDTEFRFGYDGDGRIASVEKDGKQLQSVLVDEHGRRLKVSRSDGSSTVHIDRGYEVNQSASGSSVVQHLFDRRGPVAVVTDQVTGYLRRDLKGSPTHCFEADGTMLSVVAYDGFGKPVVIQGDPVSPYYYEGKRYDSDTGLYDFGARYYDPRSGRFLTPDSFVSSRDALRADAWNRFAFELNSPPVHVDPSGHVNWEMIGIGAALVLVTIAGIALTVVTGGASDAVAASADSALASGEGGIELTSLSAEGAAETGAAGTEAAGTAATDTAAQAGTSIGRAYATQLIGGTVGGATSGAGISGLTYIISAGDHATMSGLLHAMERGAISGAVTGFITAGAGPLIMGGIKTVTGRIIAGACAGGAANLAGLMVSSEVVDGRLPSSPWAYVRAAGMGGLSGGLGAGWGAFKKLGQGTFREVESSQAALLSRKLTGAIEDAKSTLLQNPKLLAKTAGAALVTVEIGWAAVAVHGSEDQDRS